MENDRDHFGLLTLPGSQSERSRLEERLETLSVRESYALAAALIRRPPKDQKEAIGCLQFLEEYKVCFPAGSYEQLGKFCLQKAHQVPEAVLPYVDLNRLGRQYAETHAGNFVGDCYVEFPDAGDLRSGNWSLLEDRGWSVKLKIASLAVPDGVWLRLPDYEQLHECGTGEITLACHALQVSSLDECTLLEARCVLAEAGDLMAQYSSVTELVEDGNALGIVLDERGQGAVHWMERFAAALEAEGCRTLKLALDISQNLHCYEWVPCRALSDFAARHLRSCGVSEEVIRFGAIDLTGYGSDLLESAGYMLTSGETGYVLRNGREFIHCFTAPPASQERSMEPTL